MVFILKIGLSIYFWGAVLFFITSYFAYFETENVKDKFKAYQKRKDLSQEKLEEKESEIEEAFNKLNEIFNINSAFLLLFLFIFSLGSWFTFFKSAKFKIFALNYEKE